MRREEREDGLIGNYRVSELYVSAAPAVRNAKKTLTDHALQEDDPNANSDCEERSGNH